MEVILLERISRLGNMGDTVKVRDGYGRNFLIPRSKALRATKENKALFETKRAEIEARNAEAKREAEGKAKAFEGASVTLVRQASEEGKLYGSVTVRDIADALTEKGFSVQRSQIVLRDTIKTTGTYRADVQFHAEITVPVDVTVVRNDSEAGGAEAA